MQLIILGELIDYSSGEKSKFAIGHVAQGAYRFDIPKPKAWPKVCEVLKRIIYISRSDYHLEMEDTKELKKGRCSNFKNICQSYVHY